MTPGLDFSPIAKQESLEEFIEEGRSGGAAARLLLGIHYWGQCHRDQVKTGCIALWTQLALLDIQALDLNAFPSPL